MADSIELGTPINDVGLGESGDAGVSVLMIDSLPEETLWQGYDLGEVASEADLILPDALTGQDADGKPLVIDGVTWRGKPPFDPTVSGIYMFSPALPEGLR